MTQETEQPHGDPLFLCTCFKIETFEEIGSPKKVMKYCYLPEIFGKGIQVVFEYSALENFGSISTFEPEHVGDKFHIVFNFKKFIKYIGDNK